MIEINEYIIDRVQKQIAWYEIKADSNKNLQFIVSSLTIIIAVALPIILTLLDSRVIPASLSAALAVLIAANYVFRFNDNWVNYRVTAEQLKNELYMFKTKTGIYADTDIDTDTMHMLFVESIESLISRENTLWISKALNPVRVVEKPNDKA